MPCLVRLRQGPWGDVYGNPSGEVFRTCLSATCVSTGRGREVLDLQRNALMATGVDARHLFEDRVTGSRGDRADLIKALAFIKPDHCLVVWKLEACSTYWRATSVYSCTNAL
jgi:hypothetical protein